MKWEREGRGRERRNWKLEDGGTGDGQIGSRWRDEGWGSGFHFRYETISADGKRNSELAPFVARLTTFKATYFQRDQLKSTLKVALMLHASRGRKGEQLQDPTSPNLENRL